MNLHAIARLMASLLVIFVWSGCYTDDLVKPLESVENTARVEAEFCTENPQDLVFPVKVLFVLDSSCSMNDSDPQRLRVDAVESVVDEYIDFPGYHFGLMSFSNDIEILTPPDEPFTEERSVMQDALANVPNGYGNTNYSAALSQAYTLITTDIAENPEEAPRTTYITIFMSDGVPTDNMGDAHYESIVAQIATLL